MIQFLKRFIRAPRLPKIQRHKFVHLDRIPQFDYDRLLWGERQIRSVANMTRDDARDFLRVASEIGLRPKVTSFPLDHANDALIALKEDSIDGAAVIVA